jgi:hypothetical protein
MWEDRPMPFNEAKRKPGKAQHQVTRCTTYGWPVGPTFKR